MSRVKKTAAEIRDEAAAMARWEAIEREQTGDPEGAGCFRELAQAISRIRLTKDRLQ